MESRTFWSYIDDARFLAGGDVEDQADLLEDLRADAAVPDQGSATPSR